MRDEGGVEARARTFRAFCRSKSLGGNPALVLHRHAQCDAEDYRRLSRENVMEVSVVAHATSEIRFYSPTGELEFCGHGLLSAAAAIDATASWTFVGTHGLIHGRREVDQDGATYIDYETTVGRGYRVDDVALHVAVCEALAATSKFVEGMFIAGGLRPKTVVQFATREALSGIRQQTEAMQRVCSIMRTTGVYGVFVEDGRTLHARHFPAGVGLNEDPATGNGVQAILSLMYSELLTIDPAFVILQGDDMRVPCTLHGSLRGTTARIGGVVREMHDHGRRLR